MKTALARQLHQAGPARQITMASVLNESMTKRSSEASLERCKGARNQSNQRVRGGRACVSQKKKTGFSWLLLFRRGTLHRPAGRGQRGLMLATRLSRAQVVNAIMATTIANEPTDFSLARSTGDSFAFRLSVVLQSFNCKLNSCSKQLASVAAAPTRRHTRFWPHERDETVGIR